MRKLVKLNSIVSMHKKPVLGSVSGKKPIMALAVDEFSPKNNIKGIARVIYKRKGTPNIPGFIDRSKLILVKSKNGLDWKKIGNLKIKGIDDIIVDRTKDDRYFIGLEDPDILVDENGRKHVYFTIAFKYKGKNWYDVYVGHAEGDSLKNLTATEPILGKVDNKIAGFKEICPSPLTIEGLRLILAETFVNRGGERKYSAISVSKARDFSKKWDYQKLVHDPEKETKNWCAGHSSPCRIFDPDFLNYNGYLVGIMNGREPTKKVYGKKLYGKFRPGLFLFDGKLGEIVWIDDSPLFEDPDAKTITFASDFIQTGKDKGILYCHVDDSFVRAYEINAKELRKYLKEKVRFKPSSILS